jgi:hypothetical protein
MRNIACCASAWALCISAAAPLSAAEAQEIRLVLHKRKRASKRAWHLGIDVTGLSPDEVEESLFHRIVGIV